MSRCFLPLSISHKRATDILNQVEKWLSIKCALQTPSLRATRAGYFNQPSQDCIRHGGNPLPIRTKLYFKTPEVKNYWSWGGDGRAGQGRGYGTRERRSETGRDCTRLGTGVVGGAKEHPEAEQGEQMDCADA